MPPVLFPFKNFPTGDQIMNETAQQETAALECRNINRSFGSFIAVDNVSFSVPEGSFFSILGPSGCGKTTILRMAAGFLEPTSGDIYIKGKSMVGVAPNKRPVNMVFQHLALFPMMNVKDNIGYGLRRRGVDCPSRRSAVHRAARPPRRKCLCRCCRQRPGGEACDRLHLVSTRP